MFVCALIVAQVDTNLVLSDDDADMPEIFAKDMSDRATKWLGRVKTRRGASGWRPKKLRKAAARKVVRVLDRQLFLLTGKGLARYRRGKGKHWQKWNR